MSLEGNAVLSLTSAIDDSFAHAVETILAMSSEGRVIVSGIGKAGFIAMKISATFASTGVPSFFLHPAEAVHGDLGRYTKQDVALLLSNSGETDELIRIIPHIKRMGCPIISLTAQGGSNLARYSDITLTIGKLREAGPLGLAPTTTTTTMLALGDALAMAVLNQKDFTKEQFAFFHPGGEIGRSLLTVQEVMRTGEENCIVHENVRVREMLHSITNTKGRPGAASVVHSDGTLAGVYTDGQLRRDLEQGADFLDFPASKVMTAKPKTILPDKLADEAMQLMSEFKIDQLIVIDESNKPIGLIDIQDLVSIRPKV